MKTNRLRTVEPPGRPRPHGYSSAVAAHGEQLFIAGQIGSNAAGTLVSDDFAEQTAQALRNVVEILRAADAQPAHIVRMTWYVVDRCEYRAALPQVGASYRAIVGRHYPAMTLVQVVALLEDGAKVEIEVTAVIPSTDAPADTPSSLEPPATRPR
jgi:enamine deaminase RidA (YjgF/YER057c/UK114 family)